ncbi:MAG TPA: protein kinase [Vicinamibacterales bacterium]|nr:protein kinase [Vicinamibacterales bacterium]
MLEPNEILASVAGAIADGRPVDWTATDSADLSPEVRVLLAQLQVLERVHAVHTRGSSGASSGLTTPKNETRPESSLPAWRHLDLLEVLGTGAFGVVYRAWDPHLAREVALKVLTRDASFGALVIQEASLLARVRHPNVVSIYGADRFNGEVGLWMELVRGRTLKDVIRERGTFGAREAALVGLDLTRALAAVHGAGLVHRDVKAQNVMREEGGRIVLMDFGAGVDVESEGRTFRQKLIGTPVYVAPEQFDEPHSTPRSDIYSLGVLLYHIVTGSYPITASDLPSAEAAHEKGERRRLRDARPDLPAGFIRIVERAMQPDPQERYATAGELEIDLADFVVRDERRIQEAATARDRQSERHTLLAAALAAVVLVTASIAGWMYWSRRDRSPEYPATAAGLRSIAVLPFANLTGDPAQDYFVDGMTDLLNDHLASISSLRVTSRTSAMSFKDAKQPATRIGSALNVEGLIEGSVARSGDQLRVTVQLIHAGTDVRLWGHTYEREVKDAFRLQSEIARTIAGELRAVFDPERQAAAHHEQQVDASAQDLFLRGRFLMHTYNRESLEQARAFLEQAVEVNPRFSMAWASLARCYTMLENTGVLSSAEAARLAAHAANEALRADPTAFEAHATLADVLFKFDWNWEEADAHYRQAIDANSSASFARGQYAQFLSAAGRLADAEKHARLAELVDPLSAAMRIHVAVVLFYQRRYPEALEKSSEALDLEPGLATGHLMRARALLALDRPAEALAAVEKSYELTKDPAALFTRATIFAAAGRPEEAEAFLASTRELVGGSPRSLDRAYVEAALGRRADALQNLARAVDQRSSRVLWLRVDPRVDSLRTTSEFKVLLQRIGGLEGPR